METLLHDLRLALRALRRNPGFGAATLLTLALGIGGTCAAFSVVNDIFLRPLPFADEGRLLRLRDSTRAADGGLATVNTSGAHFLEIAAQSRTLAGLTAQDARSATLTGSEFPEHVDAALISQRGLQLLGVHPQLGRDFTPDEERLGEDAGVALISAHLWRSRFGADPEVLRSSLELDGRPLHIVGVLPPGYRFPYDADLWLPLRVTSATGGDYAVFARLAPGVGLEQARAELAAIATRMRERDPRTLPGYAISAEPLRKSLVQDEDRIAVALLIVLAFFLLLACVNVAMLLLARSAARQREFAIRSALGAGPWRQARQLLTESATVALLGGGLGLLASFWVAPRLILLVPRNLSLQLGMQEAPLDLRVPAFALGLSLLTAVLAGLLPALHASRPDLQAVLKGAAPGADPLRRRRLLGSFVSGQIALGVILLCGAGMVIENFSLLRGSVLGFDARNLYTAELTLPQRRYVEGAARGSLVDELSARLSRLPGIEAVGMITANPLRGATWSIPIAVEGRDDEAGRASQSVNHRLIAPGTLAAMGIPLLRGRDVGRQDVEGAERVVIVSSRLAARLWPGADAVGRRLRIAREGSPWLTVIGVAGDVRDAGDLRETWYLPYAQNAATSAALDLNLMLRSPLPEQTVARELRMAVVGLDALLSVNAFAPMERVRAENLAPDRLGAATVSMFALLGLLLAAIGTYGVVAYALVRREREIGIRLALGAEPRDVLRLVLRESLLHALFGVALGLAAMVAVQGLLAARLPEAGGTDPRLFAAVAALFLGVAAFATWLPGRRAIAIDPASALRSE